MEMEEFEENSGQAGTEELKKRYLKQRQEEQKELEAEAKIDSIMRQLLEQEAKQRLGNVRIVNRELYLKAVQAIIYLQNQGQLRARLSDAGLKQLLERLSQKRETKITRK